MGRRHESLSFMPGYLVFPGGKLDPEEIAQSQGDVLHNHLKASLRECQEETGYTPKSKPFHSSSAQLIARAITPEASPRRYDTLFFLTDGRNFHKQGPPSGELQSTGRFSVTTVLDQEPLADITFEILRLAQKIWDESEGLPQLTEYQMYQYGYDGLRWESCMITSDYDGA